MAKAIIIQRSFTDRGINYVKYINEGKFRHNDSGPGGEDNSRYRGSEAEGGH